MNVTEKVVKHDYCIGCGVCAGICPTHNLKMDWSDKGELIPFKQDNCKEKCSLCLEVCPFYSQNQDQLADSLFKAIPEIDYDQRTGYHLRSYVGQVKDEKQRLSSASGGAATDFLQSLLDQQVVDKVVVVAPGSERMFEFKVFGQDVRSSAGSAYYPVEISTILQTILQEENEDTYAIIALPCVVYALRKAWEKLPKLQRKIKLIASLTCGQLQNRFCSECLALESGINLDELSSMDFRRKNPGKTAYQYSQVAKDKNGKEGTPLINQGLPFHLWYYHYFKHNACNFCDDVFGELADVTFMDAWLPGYVKDYRGTSLVIARTPQAVELLENSPGTVLNTIGIDQVIKSQNGVINKKKNLIKGKLYKKELNNHYYPPRRVNSDEKIYKSNREFIDLTDQVQDLSKKTWPQYRHEHSTKSFWEEMKDVESRIKKYKRKSRFKTLFNRILNR